MKEDGEKSKSKTENHTYIRDESRQAPRYPFHVILMPNIRFYNV